MAKYMKRPIEIEAVQIKAVDYNPTLEKGERFDGFPFSEYPEWLAEAVENRYVLPHTRNNTDYAEWDIVTEEGTTSIGPGDYIVLGVLGEIYPCREEVFIESYEQVQ